MGHHTTTEIFCPILLPTSAKEVERPGKKAAAEDSKKRRRGGLKRAVCGVRGVCGGGVGGVGLVLLGPPQRKKKRTHKNQTPGGGERARRPDKKMDFVNSIVDNSNSIFRNEK